MLIIQGALNTQPREIGPKLTIDLCNLLRGLSAVPPMTENRDSFVKVAHYTCFKVAEINKVHEHPYENSSAAVKKYLFKSQPELMDIK